MSLRIGLIGCGWIAENCHGPSLRKYARLHEGLILAACSDVNESRAVRFKEMFGFEKHYTDYTEMLLKERLDAIYVLTPPELTAQVTLTVIQRKIPIFIEKPPGINRDETLQLIDAVEKHQVPNMVAFNRRFAPMIRELKKSLQMDFKPEELHEIDCDFFRVNRRNSDFFTTAIHGIDTVRYFAGSDYRRIGFHYQEFPQLGETVANIRMDCRFESGAEARITFCPVSGVTVERFTINALDHTYFLNLPVWDALDSPGRLIHSAGGKVLQDVSGDEISDGPDLYEYGGFFMENATFLDHVSAETRPVHDLRSALQSVEVAECIRSRRSEYIADAL